MRLITRKKPTFRKPRVVRAHATTTPNATPRQAPPLREMPACLKNRKPGDVLNNSQCIEVLEWMANCLSDAAIAAGLRT